MEPTNFEQLSREKFEERTMQPSAKAWEKLEGMLDEAQPQKKKRPIAWYAIAASFIGFVFIASIFFNQGSGDENQLVEKDVNSEILKTDPTILKEALEPKEEIATTQINDANEKGALEHVSKTNNNGTPIIKDAAAVIEDARNNNALSSVTNQNTKANTEKVQMTSVAVNDTAKEEQVDKLNISEENKKDSQVFQRTPVNLKVEEVVAQVKELKKSKTEVTEADIDALLLKAQSQVQLNRILTDQKVDAMALLNDVEMEMDRSFREKVFYALEEGFDYVKSTIVLRDD